MSDPSLYTVGWICAIETEYVAAQSFLDEEHDGPESVATRDNNDYTLGRMGRHNVVIAVLPDGEYGLTSAATVARDMVHSFPNIRIGLMVGIGGGAPSAKHDIRLGDIVVSSPGDGEGGVFQYDFGKAVQNKKFEVTRRLDQPPQIVRTAVSGLKAQYRRKGHKLAEAVDGVLAQNTRLKATHARPDPKSDILYQSGYVHSDPNKGCAQICNAYRYQKIRTPRSEQEDNPAVHYGLIASANRVMKDASVRDSLIAEKDVLCFEMEAAGLMNHFPCLVVRGICDYSDSHKNKAWQGYAAMAAAAYTKDLLARIAPNKIEAERKIKDALADVLNSVERVEEGVKAVGLKLDQQEDEAILDWVAPGDWHRCQHADYLKQRQPGTGGWLLTSDCFRDWLAAESQTLFCVGIPGAGKTILTSVVAQHLQSRAPAPVRMAAAGAVGVALVYCNVELQHEQGAEHLLSSMLKQLSQGLRPLPECVRKLYENHKNSGTQPSLADISGCLREVAKGYARSFVLVDALDEYRPRGSHARERLVSELFGLQRDCGTNLFFTSRHIPEIADLFSKVPGVVSLEIEAHKGDIERYLDGNMSQLPKFVDRRPDLQKAIKEAIVTAVCGMFLLAKLWLDALTKMHSPSELKSTLETLTGGAEACERAYEETMERRIEDEKFARRVLSWIVCAKRPLTAIELKHALAVRSSDTSLDEENMPDTDDIVSCCAGLVTVDKDSDVIRLVHQSAYEYFRRQESRARWFADAEARIAEICVTYLSFDAFKEGFCPSDQEFEARIQSHPFYSYTARYWGYHVRECQQLGEKVRAFLLGRHPGLDARREASSQAMMASSEYTPWPGYSQDIPRNMTGLHLAACFGAANAVKELIASQMDCADLRDSYDRTPLSWAAAFDHKDVVELLLTEGKADPNWRDKDGRTPLSLAAEYGYAAVVERLLKEQTVDANRKDKNGWTPLTWAARNGCVDAVRLLLDKAELRGTESHAPLLVAVQNGHATVAELILSSPNADRDWKAEGSRKARLWAAEKGDGQVDMLNRLMEQYRIDGASLKDENGLTLLMKAVQNEDELAVRQMMMHERANAYPNEKDKLGRTALLLAAEYNRESIFRFLFGSPGVDVDCSDDLGQTPLLKAARYGAAEIVKFLLDSGRAGDPDQEDKYGYTALYWAAQGGHDAVVELLLDSGKVDVNSKNGTGSVARTPLAEAEKWSDRSASHLRTAKLLAERGGISKEFDESVGLDFNLSFFDKLRADTDSETDSDDSDMSEEQDEDDDADG
ncbi:hypothetical protein VTG60DRAFT_717 [Thermothelomyces hinnuleus]